MKFLLQSLIALLIAVSPAAFADQDNHKVIFQLSEHNRDRLVSILRNTKNVSDDIGIERVDIAVLAFSGGVKTLAKENSSDFQDAIREAQGRGVVIYACNNTMRRLGISISDLPEGVEVVSSGVGTLTRRSNEGWAIIRP
jgi:intracellular sulfur oxidation DsrE/DsrF family protein